MKEQDSRWRKSVHRQLAHKGVKKMKFGKRFTFVCCITGMIIGMMACGGDSWQETADSSATPNADIARRNNDIDVASFRVIPGTKSWDISDILNDPTIHILSVETTYVMGDRTWFDTIYEPKATTEAELRAEVMEARRKIWSDILSNGHNPQPDEIAQYEAGNAFLQTVQETAPDPDIFSLKLMGKTDRLKDVALFLAEPEGIGLLSEAHRALQDTRIEENTASSAAFSPPSSEKWMPESGYVTTGNSPSYSGYRYIEETVKWDDKSGFSSSGHYSAYEHELYFDTSDGKTYLSNTTTSWSSCYPNLYRSSHNFPASAYAYLDTRLSGNFSYCVTQPLEFTFGLVFASKVSAGVTYTVQMHVSQGFASSDAMELQGELGYCLLPQSTCASYLTWGIDSEKDTANMCMIPFRSANPCSSWWWFVPGSWPWTW